MRLPKRPDARRLRRVRFFLFYIKKKIQKYMSVLKYFKNIPRSPSHKATGPKCNFFFKFATKSLEKKKAQSPVGGATGACRPAHGRQGPVAPPPTGDWAFFFQGPILSYSCVYSSSSSARSRPLPPTARNLSFIKSQEKIARTSLISRALWNPQT